MTKKLHIPEGYSFQIALAVDHMTLLEYDYEKEVSVFTNTSTD